MSSSIKRFVNYLGDVRREIDKVTWPSRREVFITTVVVIALACVFAIFFAVVDTIWYRTVQYLIGA